MKKRERGQGGRGWEEREQEEKKGEKKKKERGERRWRQKQIPGGLQFQGLLCSDKALFKGLFLCYLWQCPQAVILPLSIKIKQDKKKHTKVYNISKKNKSGQQSHSPQLPLATNTVPKSHVIAIMYLGKRTEKGGQPGGVLALGGAGNPAR